MNCLTEIATKNARLYVTPEDVTEAIKTTSLDVVRLSLLEVLGKQTRFGVEDYSLCAYLAYKGVFR